MTFPLTKSAFKKHLESMRPRQIAGVRCSVCRCPIARAAPDWREIYQNTPSWAKSFMGVVDRGEPDTGITAGKCLQIGRELGLWK